MGEWVDVTAASNFVLPDAYNFFRFDGQNILYGTTDFSSASGFLEFGPALVGLAPLKMRLTISNFCTATGAEVRVGQDSGGDDYVFVYSNDPPEGIPLDSASVVWESPTFVYPDAENAVLVEGDGLFLDNYCYVDSVLEKIEFFIGEAAYCPPFWQAFLRSKEIDLCGTDDPLATPIAEWVDVTDPSFWVGNGEPSFDQSRNRRVEWDGDSWQYVNGSGETAVMRINDAAVKSFVSGSYGGAIARAVTGVRLTLGFVDLSSNQRTKFRVINNIDPDQGTRNGLNELLFEQIIPAPLGSDGYVFSTQEYALFEAELNADLILWFFADIYSPRGVLKIEFFIES